MKADRLERFLKNIHDTQEHEISCSECFEAVSRYVEIELSGADPVLELPQVKQHLLQCPACRAEYETLRDLQRLDDEGSPPSLGDLLP